MMSSVRQVSLVAVVLFAFWTPSWAADPTHIPTSVPTADPTHIPTGFPTGVPTTAEPTGVPTAAPSTEPTLEPTMDPTVVLFTTDGDMTTMDTEDELEGDDSKKLKGGTIAIL